MNKTLSTIMPIVLFLCGDVMTGRGIDQILPYPSNPALHEPYVKDARDYIALAERIHGKIPRSVDFSYIWEDALAEFARLKPDLRIINLETSITTNDEYWKQKDIHYRMHPKNTSCLTAAGIDCCVLANNHALDWGYAGLVETLETLEGAQMKTVGAGRNLQEAEAPAVFNVSNKGRVLVYAYGHPSSGVPLNWGADVNQAGVNVLPDLSPESVFRIKEKVEAIKQPGDIVVFSIHWGSNWGYEIPQEHMTFAHQLIDQAQVDVIHGHSSHHLRAIEVYKGKLILYGCGDFLNDYEGISGYEVFRDDLTLMYFVNIDPVGGSLVSLQMVPIQIGRFQLQYASKKDTGWLWQVLNREGRKWGTRVKLGADNMLILQL